MEHRIILTDKVDQLTVGILPSVFQLSSPSPRPSPDRFVSLARRGSFDLIQISLRDGNISKRCFKPHIDRLVFISCKRYTDTTFHISGVVTGFEIIFDPLV